jgi:hypothetical protein
MSALRLGSVICAVLGLGLHGWLLVELRRWAKLPHSQSADRILVALCVSGGLCAAVTGGVAAALPVPEFTAAPWQGFLYTAFGVLATAWLHLETVKGELLHLHAYTATRNLFSVVEETVAQHGGDATDVRRLSESVLGTPPPDQGAQPWHGRPPGWMAGLLDKTPDDHLTDAERAELDRAVARYDRAVTRFDGYRR